MVGDHSNIGGSWDDQQLADITLAWMISRFERLGVVFDPAYLYHQYRLSKEYYLRPGEKQFEPYPADMVPRQWGEGASTREALVCYSTNYHVSFLSAFSLKDDRN